MSDARPARRRLLAAAVLLPVLPALPAAAPAAPLAASAAPDAPRKDTRTMMKADRLPPDAVAPLTIGGVRYEAIHWGRRRGLDQDGGYIAAIDADSGRELWTLKVYSTAIDPAMERDVQDVFITALGKTLFGGKLKVTDELGRRYLVDPKTRSVGPDR